MKTTGDTETGTKADDEIKGQKMKQNLFNQFECSNLKIR